jgi:hypothetical protein
VTEPSILLPPVNSPPRHYAPGRFGLECIHLTRLMSFAAGNAVKYLWRWTDKGGTDDLRKAIDYLGWAAADAQRGKSVWIGPAEATTGRVLIESWITPRVTPGEVEHAIVLVGLDTVPDLGKALELVTARIGGMP